MRRGESLYPGARACYGHGRPNRSGILPQKYATAKAKNNTGQMTIVRTTNKVALAVPLGPGCKLRLRKSSRPLSQTSARTKKPAVIHRSATRSRFIVYLLVVPQLYQNKINLRMSRGTLDIRGVKKYKTKTPRAGYRGVL